MKGTKIIALLQQKDPQGIPLFLQHYTPLMRYIIAPILPDVRDQEECLSDVAMQVWEKAHIYDPNRGSWTTWLTVITRHAALNRARKLATQGYEQQIPYTYPSPGDSPEDIVLRTERQERLATAIKALSKSEQVLFYRKYYYMQPTAQIAAELGLTERAVEGRLYRLKKRLRKKLEGDSFE